MTGAEQNGVAVPDCATAAALPNGSTLVWAVAADGSRWPWVLVPDCGPVDGCRCRRCAPNEQLGRLPAPMAARLGLLCGRPTRTGDPCRQPVRHAGDACRQHEADQQAEPTSDENSRVTGSDTSRTDGGSARA